MRIEYRDCIDSAEYKAVYNIAICDALKIVYQHEEKYEHEEPEHHGPLKKTFKVVAGDAAYEIRKGIIGLRK